MKKILFLYVFGLILISCSKEKGNEFLTEKTELETLSDRLNFSNFREMLDLYAELSKKDPNELLLWAKIKSHSTLLESQDTVIMNYSNALKTILNKDYEFQVGDSIIRFNNGDFLAFSKFESQNTELTKMKKIGSVQLSKEQSSSKGIVYLSSGQRNSAPQHEFIITQYIPCIGNPEYGIFGYRKYVCDLYHEFILIAYYPPVYMFQSSAYLRIKLEYRTSRTPWYISNNEHVINYHVYGSADFSIGYDEWMYYNFDNYRSSLGGCDNIVTVPLNVLLAITTGWCDVNDMDPLWRISIFGSINQQINGDPHSNTFSSNTWPWW